MIVVDLKVLVEHRSSTSCTRSTLRLVHPVADHSGDAVHGSNPTFVLFLDLLRRQVLDGPVALTTALALAFSVLDVLGVLLVEALAVAHAGSLDRGGAAVTPLVAVRQSTTGCSSCCACCLQDGTDVRLVHRWLPHRRVEERPPQIIEPLRDQQLRAAHACDVERYPELLQSRQFA